MSFETLNMVNDIMSCKCMIPFCSKNFRVYRLYKVKEEVVIYVLVKEVVVIFLLL